MKFTVFLLLIMLIGCSSSREISGNHPRITPEQIAWLEQRVENDYSIIQGNSSDRVILGKIIIRADGEVINGTPILQAAKRGLVKTGAVEVVDQQEATLIVNGEVNVNAFQDGNESGSRYVFEIRLFDLTARVVKYSQTYIINNRYSHKRWK